MTEGQTLQLHELHKIVLCQTNTLWESLRQGFDWCQPWIWACITLHLSAYMIVQLKMTDSTMQMSWIKLRSFVCWGGQNCICGDVEGPHCVECCQCLICWRLWNSRARINFEKWIMTVQNKLFKSFYALVRLGKASIALLTSGGAWTAA